MQAEYRRPLWWRLGAVVFGGVGDVYGESASEVTFGNLKYSYGLGLRYLFNSRDKQSHHDINYETPCPEDAPS